MRGTIRAARMFGTFITIWFNYDLTKAAAFMAAGGWRLRTHVLTVGPVGLALIWKKKSDA